MINNKDKILNLILNNSLDLIAFHELDGKYIYLSPSVENLLGYTPKELEGKDPYTLFHPDDVKKIKEGSHKETKEGKQNVVVDYRVKRKDGTYKWVQTISKSILDADGNPEKILTVTRDIEKFIKLQEEYEFKEKVSLEAESLAKVGGWEVDLVKNTVWWSKQVSEIHEVPGDYVPVLEEGINFYAPEARPIITKAVEEGIAEGKAWDLELPIITAKGNRKYIRTIGKAMFEAGKPIKLYGAFQDIDEQKKKRLEVEALKARLETATKAGGIGVWDWDVVNNVLEWDDNTFTIYGVKRKDFSAAYDAWEKGLHPDDKDQAKADVEAALKGEKEFDSLFRVIHPNGDIKCIKGLAEVLRDKEGNPVRMIGVNYDITRDIERDEALKLSEEKFRGSFENSSVGKALVSLEGKMTQVNQAWVDMLGYTKEELTKLTFQEFTHPDDLEEDLQYVQQLIDGEGDSYIMEKRYFKKSGHTVWVILSVSIIRDLDKNPLYFISEVQDITERKEAEEEVEQKNLELRDLVEKLTSHNYQLKEYNSIVSHNLRAPVSNLNALMNLINDKNSTEADKEFMRKQMQTSIEKITETLDHLVEVVKIRENRDIEFSTINLNDVYSKVKSQLMGKILEGNVNISTDFSKLAEVNYPALYIESIFLNMMDNAIKYKSEDRPLKITITSEVNGKFNIINFADNGLGIDLDRHGDKMFKLHKTFHRRKDSKGFGLFMLKNQIETLGGQISCTSKVDEGSTFTIKILK